MGGHRGDLDDGARPRGQRVRAQADGVADALRRGDLLLAGELDRAAVPGDEPAARGERRGPLLDEERDALRARHERGGEHGPRAVSQPPRGQLDRLPGSQRAERDLLQRPCPAQLGAQRPDGMASRGLVAAVGAHEEDGHVPQCQRQRRQDAGGGGVRLLQVVEHHDDWASGAQVPGRLGHRGRFPRAQDAGERPGGRRRVLVAAVAHDERVAAVRHRGDRRRLADPGLAGDEDHAAASARGLVAAERKGPLLLTAADERGLRPDGQVRSDTSTLRLRTGPGNFGNGDRPIPDLTL
ncbi:MAG: hypothetical protein AVDCRST_MAG13-3119 [uncultured Solirubrobacteraceae bacterium]|uniref:Uncharacterized protein n=1 Tax=uncultured Solirubrobacteraceae bacterium TaxID=1162706 RepID=A0A6J4T8D4_9ACTN|nr:MAG: hypothetical protein AVDCRST_MAG13-3119 [uncultured Solirubrobacteraceae bacterium]